MEVERQTTLYEVLVRFGPEGLRGAHAMDLERLIDTDTGDVISEQEGKARPITVEEVGELLGTENAALLEAVDKEKSRAAAIEANAADLVRTVASLEDQLAAERAGRAAAETKLASIASLLA